MNLTTGNVQHDAINQRFILAVENDQAVLEYRLLNDASANEKKSIDFTHTWVPPTFRGKGLAEKLVRTGLSWAKEEGFEIRASCWYVAKFLRASTNTPS